MSGARVSTGVTNDAVTRQSRGSDAKLPPRTTPRAGPPGVAGGALSDNHSPALAAYPLP